MERRNTVQKDLVLKAVLDMRGHVTADEVYEHIHNNFKNIGKGTVYRNLNQLAEEEKIRKVELPEGPDRFDFTLQNHYHVRCVKCNQVFDVDMDEVPDVFSRIKDTHGMKFLDYDIVFKGVCSECAEL